MLKQDFEKLGVFYLGKRYDLASRKTTDELLLYDSKDLTTHAVCVGMTGSGKTGLCISLLEEAAMDGIPAIAIDPKGDLSNLMLTFPGLSPDDFLPWIDPEDAERKGVTAEQLASDTADAWKAGLARWGQDGERIRELKSRAEFRLYTPGGSNGIPLSILHSLDAPSQNVMNEPEALAERIETAVSGFLSLAGGDDLDVHGREHVLLQSILAHAWGEGRDMTLAELVRAVQNPPMKQLGVLDVESFYPSGERLKLAMMLNSLAASPGFAPWTRGEPLSIENLLRSPEGKPRVSILSIAHLSDKQRMFFVSLLLNEVVAWMRSKPGTGSLRAILYMDEIFGFFPPGAEPPSKKPMLTLLKQARAYGLGVVLAAQNPVDLDYRGLSNTGTWFVGRLQTERDKLRLLDGLESASANVLERSEMDRLLSGLDKRVFLLHSVHRSNPVLFQTRWAMSYLRGPLTGMQLKKLQQGAPSDPHAEPPRPRHAPSPSKPWTPPEIEEFHTPLSVPLSSGQTVLYRPHLFASVKLHFVSAREKIDLWEDCTLTVPAVTDDTDAWTEAACTRGKPYPMDREPAPNPSYEPLAPEAVKAASMKHFNTRAASWLYQEQTLSVWYCLKPKAASEPGEEKGAFAARLLQLDRENRDLQVEKLRDSFEKRLVTVQDRVRRAEQKLEREKSQYSHQRTQTAVSVGATIMGALLGGRIGTGSVGRATTAVRGASRASRERQDIASAESELEVQRERLNELEKEFSEKLALMEGPLRAEELLLEEKLVRPRKSDTHIHRSGLLWVPLLRNPDGSIM
ncbi:MAG: hypothetical protein R6V62_04585 [Candidatus Fermentibacteraceae bacterium]